MVSPSYPWIFKYVEDQDGGRRYPAGSGRILLRPLVEVSFVGRAAMEQKVAALVDSGSEHTLIARWVAQAIGVDPNEAVRKTVLGIGGASVSVSFVGATVRLHPPGGSLNQYAEWEAEVGIFERSRAPWSVLLGQVGFFDHCTVTMHRHARALAVESFEAFDRRFGPFLAG